MMCSLKFCKLFFENNLFKKRSNFCVTLYVWKKRTNNIKFRLYFRALTLLSHKFYLKKMNIYCIKRKIKTNTTNIEKNGDIKNRNMTERTYEILYSNKYENINIIQNEQKFSNIYYNIKTGFSKINDIAEMRGDVKSVKTNSETSTNSMPS